MSKQELTPQQYSKQYEALLNLLNLLYQKEVRKIGKRKGTHAVKCLY